MDIKRARELLAEALRLRDKFHAEHMLDKEESDRFDALLVAAAKELETDDV